MSLSTDLARAERDVLQGLEGSFERLVRVWERSHYCIEKAVEFAVQCAQQVREKGLHNVEAAKTYASVEKSIQQLPGASKKKGRGFYPNPMYLLWVEWDCVTDVVLVDPRRETESRPKSWNEITLDPLKALSTRVQGKPPEVRVSTNGLYSVWIQFKRCTYFTRDIDGWLHKEGDGLLEFVQYLFDEKTPEELQNAIFLADWVEQSAPVIQLAVPEEPSWVKDDPFWKKVGALKEEAA